MKRQSLIIFLALLVLLLPFTAWSRGQEEMGPVKLAIAGRDGGYGTAMQIVADEYMKMHPDTSFDILKLPGASLYEKVVIDMKNNVGTYDVIMIDDPIATQFQKAGWLANLDDLYKKKGVPLDPDLISTATAAASMLYPM